MKQGFVRWFVVSFYFLIHALFLLSTLCFWYSPLSRVLDCAHPSDLFLVCTSTDFSWGLYHVSLSSLAHWSKTKHQYDHRHSPPSVSVRSACIFEVSHNQLCTRSTQGLKERLIVHFQGLEGVDVVGYFRKMVEAGSRLNRGVRGKMVDGRVSFLERMTRSHNLIMVLGRYGSSSSCLISAYSFRNIWWSTLFHWDQKFGNLDAFAQSIGDLLIVVVHELQMGLGVWTQVYPFLFFKSKKLSKPCDGSYTWHIPLLVWTGNKLHSNPVHAVV